MSKQSDDVERLSPMGFHVLKSLSEYRYLTTNQMLDLCIAKDRGHLGKVLAGLLSVGTKKRRPKEIGELDFGVLVGKGRLPRMYYLTARGAALLEHVEPESFPVSYPPRVVQFSSDYEHRVRTVNFHIAINQWAKKVGQDVSWFRQYFDWWPANTKRRQHPVTQITLDHKNIVPDAIFMLEAPDNTERLFCFEMANGMDSGRVIKQMREYCRGLDQGRINAAFDFGQKAIRILYLFEHQRLMELVQERALTDSLLQRYAPHFFLKSCNECSAETIKDNWHRVAAGKQQNSLF